MKDWQILLIIIFLILWTYLLIIGIKKCFKNNAIGVFILFIVLNIFGLILGIAILWNNKKIEEGLYDKNYLPFIWEKIKLNKKEKKKQKEEKLVKKWNE